MFYTQLQVIVLDFGSQYTQLLAKKVRDVKIFCEIFPYNTPLETIKNINPKAIILSGGPNSVYEENAPLISNELFHLNIPILGICYGMQLISQMLGGVVKPLKREFGKQILNVIDSQNLLFTDIPQQSQVFMSHGDSIITLPLGFKNIANTNNATSVISNDKKNIYGVQFHPEVTHSKYGKQILYNFLFKIAKCKEDWQMNNYIEQAIDKIKKEVGNNKVVLGISGGVDSTVAAVLIQKAIKENLICVFIDTGLLRQNELEKVKKIYEEQFDLNIKYVVAKEQFFKALKGITNPEAKRKIIGKIFVDSFYNSVKELDTFTFLAQGTIYPDIIESAKNHITSQTIKSHHNVGGLPDDLKLKLLEPLKLLFKDEVRSVGKMLNIPDFIINRHPFPGPGLAIRVIGEVTQEKVLILQKADAIFIEELEKMNLYDKTSQSFVILLPVQSVGIMGDKRSYELTAVIRSVTSENFMTAEISKLSFDFLEKVSNRIINEVKGINRVLYDITSKPPATIEWE